MVTLKLEVTDSVGTKGRLYSYLVGTSNCAYMIKHFWASCGKPEQYDVGETPAEMCINQRGKCMLALKKSSDPSYPPSIGVVDYIPVADDDIIDDELPF